MNQMTRLVKSLLYCLICLAVFLSLASVVSMAGTAPATAWEKSYGNTGLIDTGASVWQTSDDGFIIAGTTYSKGTNSDITRLMLVKTDWMGNQMWIKYNDEGDGGNFVRQTSDGGYIVVGDNGGNLFVLKTDLNGDKVWSKTYPRPNGKTVTGESIQPTPDGGYIIAGSINMGGKDGSDMYAVKIDGNGNQQWDKTYGGDDGEVGTGADYGYSVWPTSDGGYILGGSDWSSTQWPKASLVKIDANGNQLWYKVYKEDDARMDGTFVEVQQTHDGGYIWAGYRSGKMCLLKADPNGNQQWNKSYENGQCFSVQQTWDDGYVITGGVGTGADNVTLIRTDSVGNQIWQKTLKGLGLGKGMSVQQIGNGSYVVAGITKKDKSTQDDFYLAELEKDMTPVPNAKVTAENIPTQFEANQSFSVSVTFLNNGTKPWTFQDETMFSPVGGAGGDAAVFGVTKTQTIPIGTVLRPGQSMTFQYVMTAPAMNGTYYPEVRMLWEGHDYFGQPAVKAVKVVNGTPDTRKPTAVPTAAASANPTAAQASSAPTGTPTTEGKSGLPCLSAVLPLLIVGTVSVGLYRRRNK
jgi:hypothetical protein